MGRISAEHPGVDRVADAGDIDARSRQRHHTGRLRLRGQDPRDLRVRKTFASRDDHLHIARGGFAVVDFLEAARQADGHRHRCDAEENGDQGQCAAQWAGKRVADAEHDRLRKPDSVGKAAQPAPARPARRHGVRQHDDWLEQTRPQCRQRGCQPDQHQGASQRKQPYADGEAGFIGQTEGVRAVRKERLAGDRPRRNAYQAGGQGGGDDLQDEHCHVFAGRKADRLHDPDLSIGRHHDSGDQVGDDRGGGPQREDAEGDQNAREDLVGDVEDVSDEQVVERPYDASGR